MIEDAAHAIGASTPDGPVGNCAHSDLCCFSFHPVKTDHHRRRRRGHDEHRRARRRGCGASAPTASCRRPSTGGWYYEIAELGFNYRLTDIQAALGPCQLRKLERFVARRNEIADRYRELLAGLPRRRCRPRPPPGSRHALPPVPGAGARPPRACTTSCAPRHRRAGALRADLPPSARTDRLGVPATSRHRGRLRRPAVAAAVPRPHRGRAGHGDRRRSEAGGPCRVERWGEKWV